MGAGFNNQRFLVHEKSPGPWKPGVDIPFVHHLGFELVVVDGGASELG